MASIQTEMDRAGDSSQHVEELEVPKNQFAIIVAAIALAGAEPRSRTPGDAIPRQQ